MNFNLKNLGNDLFSVLCDAVSRKMGDGVLLSGGLDTSILTYLMCKYGKPVAVTVSYGSDSPDLYYAKLMAQFLGLKHHVKFFDESEAFKAVREVIQVLKTFDPMEIRNDIPLYLGLRYAKSLGLNSVVTGDGGDELFAGYSFLFKLRLGEVEEWTRKIVETWFFAAKPLGESLGVEVLQPFTDPFVVKLALKIPGKLKINEFKGVKYGKWILRKTFEKHLPEKVVWRPKNPLEIGSGSTKLSNVFRVSKEEFKTLSKLVRLRDPEHAFYFKIYLELFGEVPRPKKGEKKCPSCGGGVDVKQEYCRICGAYPV